MRGAHGTAAELFGERANREASEDSVALKMSTKSVQLLSAAIMMND